MDERRHYTDWDDSVYGTGPMQPPKNRGGAVALMLILVIFLCGIITVLGILNIRLFREIRQQERNELSISHTPEPTAPAVTEPVLPASEPYGASNPYDSMDLQQSPASVSNVPEEGAMSLQDIYTRNIGSVVSIICNGAGSSSTGTGVILSRNGYIVTKRATKMAYLQKSYRQETQKQLR